MVESKQVEMNHELILNLFYIHPVRSDMSNDVIGKLREQFWDRSFRS